MLSVIVPGLNEERAIPALVERLTPVLDSLDLDWETIFVDDGSTDGTMAVLRALNARDPRFKAISLSRNFGKEIAVAAGLSYAKSDAVILMDSDLQHPPEMIPDFIAVAAGQVAGVIQTAMGYVGGEAKVSLRLEAYLGAPESYDSVLIEGSPRISSRIEGGVHGDIATAAMTVNAIPSVIAAAPGFHTMRDLRLPSFFPS